MPATHFLDSCYSGLSSFTRDLYFFPYSAANKVLTESRAKEHYKKMSNVNNPELEFGAKMISMRAGQGDANCIMLFLTPILLPLTIATFALALAIDIAIFVTALITYPIASVLDAAASASPSF